ncbi:MAG: hypothetical protein RMJ33_11660 [Saprospiraceae bacterium]|nr:hypothetical protein [Saprospiraceae bacterium]MDW8230486.1 hypothetical protein [Saprospiraceae bacterium]
MKNIRLWLPSLLLFALMATQMPAQTTAPDRRDRREDPRDRREDVRDRRENRRDRRN